MEFAGPKVAVRALVSGFFETHADQSDLLLSERKKLQTDSIVVATEVLACAKTRSKCGLRTELDQVSSKEPLLHV